MISGDGVYSYDHLSNEIGFSFESERWTIPVRGCLIGVDVVLHNVLLSARMPGSAGYVLELVEVIDAEQPE